MGSSPIFSSVYIQVLKLFLRMGITKYKNILLNVLNYIVTLLFSIIYKAKYLLPLNFLRTNKNYILNLLDSHLIHYASPVNLTYA
jgi:hypothetical protein